jgi:hypothetical protein
VSKSSLLAHDLPCAAPQRCHRIKRLEHLSGREVLYSFEVVLGYSKAHGNQGQWPASSPRTPRLGRLPGARGANTD